jgi:two-component system, OmpR family, phosphate regulon sensor histidine kinase PhoR
MLKNPTPRRIALYAAALITLTVFFITSLLEWLAGNMGAVLRLVLLPSLIGFVTFGIVYFFTKQFIDNRIKLIYKKITSDKNTDIDMPHHLDDVERKVDEWTAHKEQEIKTLQELEAYRRNYLGNVSHELKTPIFNIQGFLHTLLDGGLHDPNVNVSYLQKAAKNAERLQTIVEDLQAISKSDAGEMHLDLQTFDIQKLTQEVMDDMELKAKGRGIKLVFKEGANNGWMVRADREAVRQVLTNLVNNSVKYGKENGQTKIGFYDMDKIVLIEVSDNGIGIARHHLKHVFDRFYRVDKSRSREVGGSGLGLAIVKHIIEAHKQSVHWRSTEGQGSTFGFTLEKSF